ncbi:MAG TPA: DMT family transporter, partial [Novosphingobium sp.]
MSSHNRPFLALGLRLLAMVMLSAMLALVKLAGQRGVPLPETMFWRQVIPAVLLFGWLAARGQLHRLITARFWIHGRRTVLGVCSMAFTLGVVRLLPLAQATILGFTTPIFSVLLAMLLLREQVGWWRWGSVALGLIGVIVIAGPDRSALPLPGL